MSQVPKRPVLMLLVSHWMRTLDAKLATTAGFSWLFYQHRFRGTVLAPLYAQL